MRHSTETALLAITLLGAIFTAGASAHQTFTEDFTTTTYMDVSGTTADWNTVDGELRLFPFVPLLAGSYDTSGNAWQVVVEGDLAFVADNESGLQVIDISNPANPTFVANCDTPDQARSLAVSGDFAFVADNLSGLQVIDISDTANPTIVGSYNTPGYARGVAVSGNYAYVADYDHGLYVINISIPAFPMFAGTYDTPGGARGIAVSGNLVFLTDEGFGLQVIDVSNPNFPTLVGNYDTSGTAWGVAVSGDHAFVADYDAGLQVIDISDPANPTFEGSYDTAGDASGVAVSGNRAYLADHHAGLQVFDISEPTSPMLLRSYDTDGYAMGIAIAGDHAYVADFGSGLQVIVDSHAINPFNLGGYNTSGTSYAVAVSGRHAFVADGNLGLQVFDISDPAYPSYAGSCAAALARDIDVSGNYAYLACYNYGVNVVDISDPTSPMIAGSIDTSGFARGISVAGNYAFVADGGDGFVVIDVSDPTAPTQAGTYSGLGNLQDVDVAGDHAFVADYDAGLQVFNIANPANPVPSGSCATPGNPRRVVVTGNLAFVADYEGGLQVIDISAPAFPVLIGNCATPDLAQGVAVAGDHAFVAAGGSGLQMIDISNPAAPTITGNYDTNGTAWGVCVSGEHAFVADGNRGLRICKAFQSDVDSPNNLGQSLIVDGQDDLIVRVRLGSTQTSGVSWELSTAWGDAWQTATPGVVWMRLQPPGHELRWRTTHGWIPGVNPTVMDLTLDWVIASPVIAAVADVPDDQGGLVRMTIERSGYDFAEETEFPIANYNIWRQVSDPALLQLLSGVEKGVSPAGGLPRIRHEGSYFVVSDPEPIALGFPEGTWEVIAVFSALQQEQYIAPAPTLADSTAGDPGYTNFCVTVHSTTPSVWFAGPPAQGYSVDNIAPGVPTSLSAAYRPDGVTLDWDDAPENDFQYYRIYRSTDPGFTPSQGSLVHEIAASAWMDPAADPWDFHYKVTTLDHAGNESEPGLPSELTGVQDIVVPLRNSLLDAVPNPFNPSTRLAFDLAEPGIVRLVIFDAAGRRVMTLVDEHRCAGRHEAVWNGRDESGRVCAASVYMYRLEAEGYSETRRMVLVK